MKYLLLAYTSKDAWDTIDVTSAEFQATCQFYEDIGKELTETGEFVSTEGLAHPALAQTIRKNPDGLVVSDGPYAEIKEVLASYAIVDCESHDRAMEIAKRVADAVGDTIEVRPIMSGPPEPNA
ncbi:YciI family protein [Antrihabitans sp. YC2-6]|uniref:YciI family protein n=1 Tax=Antrihabitans sp. YC2-6 TaxID=2799498 RepID=UPI0018F53AF3|nr:YciI family protein [Antrihabitans sp. YC2-6]MBJ8347982.1 hypothetical protein [Antrihabitans sp. YC2-6]